MWKAIKNFFYPKPVPYKKIKVKSFTILFVDNKEFNEILDAAKPERYTEIDVNGLCYLKNRVIYVCWDENQKDKHGNIMPLVKTTGHEVLHLPELYGRWH